MQYSTTVALPLLQDAERVLRGFFSNVTEMQAASKQASKQAKGGKLRNSGGTRPAWLQVNRARSNLNKSRRVGVRKMGGIRVEKEGKKNQLFKSRVLRAEAAARDPVVANPRNSGGGREEWENSTERKPHTPTEPECGLREPLESRLDLENWRTTTLNFASSRLRPRL